MGTVTDLLLNNIAGVLSGDTNSYIPNSLAVATSDVSNIATDAVSLTGEIGTRLPLTVNIDDNSVTFSTVRSSTDVIDTSAGDELVSSGLMGALTGNNLLVGVVHNSVTQTTNFDIEFEYEIIVNRG